MVRTTDGVCHMAVARWPREAGFNAWATHSEIAYATAADPLGPYTMHHTLLPRRPGYWDGSQTHNASLKQYDGKFYLYYTGNDGTGDWWSYRNKQRCGVAVADHPAGPYRRMDRPIIDVSPGSWDHLLVSSPTVDRDASGRYFLVYKAVSEGPPPFGGNVRVGVATADSPTGPFTKHAGHIFDHPTAKFPTDDNYIWFQDGQWWAIVKDYHGHYSPAGPESLVLFESGDGFKWSLAAQPLVSRFEIRWADGQVTATLHRFEQPQVYLENGRPKVLFLAVKERDDQFNDDLSYNVHVPLGPG
jgi:hypothetical protein